MKQPIDNNGRDSSPPAPVTAPKETRIGRRKLTRGLVTLSASAVLAVYGVGYVRTQSAADQIAAQDAAAGADPIATPSATSSTTKGAFAEASNTQTTTPGAAKAPVARATATSTATTVATATTTASPYRDGTYVGTGTCRHGSIQARVVIQGGRIVSAAIAKVTTSYPASVVSSLPPVVVAKQSTSVDLISGATQSSYAYIRAVNSALAQATNA